LPAVERLPGSEWSTPVNLGPLINAERFDQSGPTLSKDERSLYFASDRAGGVGHNDLWVAHRAHSHAEWGPPQNLGATLNSAGDDFAPSFSNDRHWMYFSSDRAGGCGGQDLYVSYRRHTNDDFGWETPTNLGCVVNTALNDWLPDVFEDEETGVMTLLFSSSRPGGPGLLNTYVTTQAEDGSFVAPALVPELSSSARDARPAIARNGLELYIASNRSGGVGDWDLWVSRRSSTHDAWSEPVNAGAALNTPYFEAAPALSEDGSMLFFRSTRPGGTGVGDIWVSTRRHGHGEKSRNKRGHEELRRD
jgi:hypothetical protein